MEFYSTIHTLDFAPPIVVPTGCDNEINGSTVLQESDPAYKSVFHILTTSAGRGTGVVIGKFTNTIKIRGRTYTHLGVTAGHVVGNSVGALTNSGIATFHSSICNWDEQYKAKYLVLKDYASLAKSPQIDPTSKHPYILPDDMALLLLKIPFFDASVMPILDSINESDELVISGYPIEPSRENLLYCSPCLKGDSTFYTKIKTAFCGFGRKVLSIGRPQNLIKDRDCMLAGTYSATQGMSGSPVYVLTSEGCKLVGINCGGCSLPYQYHIGQIIQHILILDYDTAEDLLNQFVGFIQTTSLYDSDPINKEIQSIKEMWIKGEWDSCIQFLKNLTSLLAINYLSPFELDHNLSIPFWSENFSEIKKIVEVCYSCPSMNFPTCMEFYHYLLNL